MLIYGKTLFLFILQTSGFPKDDRSSLFCHTLVQFQGSKLLIPKEEYGVNVKNWDLPAEGDLHKKRFRDCPECTRKIQVTCYKLQNKETQAIRLIKVSLYGVRHLPKKAVLLYKPGEGGPLTYSLKTRCEASPRQTVSLRWVKT